MLSAQIINKQQSQSSIGFVVLRSKNLKNDDFFSIISSYSLLTFVFVYSCCISKLDILTLQLNSLEKSS